MGANQAMETWVRAGCVLISTGDMCVCWADADQHCKHGGSAALSWPCSNTSTSNSRPYQGGGAAPMKMVGSAPLSVIRHPVGVRVSGDATLVVCMSVYTSRCYDGLVLCTFDSIVHYALGIR